MKSPRFGTGISCPCGVVCFFGMIGVYSMRYWDGFHPDPNVIGPELKIERARYHIDLLWEEIRKFFRENYANVVVEQCDLDTREKFWVVAEEPPAPPLYLSTIIGDALYSLRSALDHLVHELIRANGQQPTGKSAFPIITTNEPDYDRVATIQVQGMNPYAAAAIKTLQPYNRRHRHRDKWLRLLKYLNDIDKHRHLHLVVPATAGSLFDRGVPMDAKIAIHQGVLKLGTEIARVPEEHMDVQTGFMPEIAFSDPEAFNEPVYQLLIGIREFVIKITSEFRRDYIK